MLDGLESRNVTECPTWIAFADDEGIDKSP